MPGMCKHRGNSMLGYPEGGHLQGGTTLLSNPKTGGKKLKVYTSIYGVIRKYNYIYIYFQI